MKTKTINAVLTKKFTDFLESITDPELKTLVKAGTIITGGSIASMLLREKVNDYDLYFKDQATAAAVAKYFIEVFTKNPPSTFKGSSTTVKIYHEVTEDRVKIIIKSAGIAGEKKQEDYQYFEALPDTEQDAAANDYVKGAIANTEELDDEPAEKLNEKDAGSKYRPIFLSSNAITLAGKIQLIVRFFGMPEDIHRNYDFTHCTSYWTSWDGVLTLRKEALEALMTRELRYVGSKYPICSVIRTRKFLGRGWTINAGQFVKMAWQISLLDLSDMSVLEDQLVGVDSAYFIQVIAKLKSSDTPERIDGTYLMTVIDQLF